MGSLRALVSLSLLAAGCVPTPWIGTPATVAAGERGRITAIAADDDHVFWLATESKVPGLQPRADGTLWYMQRSGGTPMTLASRLPLPQHILLDAKNVYFTTWGASDFGGVPTKRGALLRVSKLGQAPALVANDLDELGGLVADESHLYCVAGRTRILAIAKKGGPPRVVAEGLTGAHDLVRDDRRLYFVSDSSIWSVPKEGGAPPTMVVGTKGLIRTEWVESLAADGENLYWLGSSGAHALRKQAMAGGPIENVPWPSTTAPLGPGKLHANGRVLIYQPAPGTLRTDRALVGIRTQGGPPVLQIPEPVTSVHADPRELYWSSGPTLKRMPFPGLPAN
jgi:hypothetical protein